MKLTYALLIEVVVTVEADSDEAGHESIHNLFIQDGQNIQRECLLAGLLGMADLVECPMLLTDDGSVQATHEAPGGLQ
jgi:hypothetical protein